jgi:hypothetical protein
MAYNRKLSSCLGSRVSLRPAVALLHMEMFQG